MTARVLITGVDADGRSCVVQHQPVTLSGTDEIAYSVLHATTSMPSIADKRGRVADHLDLGVAAGGISWMVIYRGASTMNIGASARTRPIKQAGVVL